MIKFFIIALLLIGSRPVSAAENSTYKIIVNAKNPASAITRKGAAKLFTKQLIRWNTGLPAVPVDLPSNDPVRQSFAQDVLALNGTVAPSQANPPAEIQLGDIVTFVQENPGAIAYVPIDFPTDGVKVLELREFQ